MLSLSLRTDRPEAEIGLFDDRRQLVYETWPAHRALAETIHLKISQTLKTQKKELSDLNGLVVFQGPGSFTGLRIGISVANALADSLSIPIVGTTGEKWLEDGLQKVQAGQDEQAVIPEYGALPRITKPKH